MFVALGFLLSLIALASAAPFVDGDILPSLAALLAAGGLVAIAYRLPPFEAERFGALSRPLAIAAAVPAALVVLQMAPLPPLLSGLAHPVWASVKAGFSIPVAASISVDTGATAMALLGYLTLVGAMLLAMATTINRDRAEAVLIALTAATTAISLAALAIQLFGTPRAAASEEALDCACLGVILAAACAVLAFERHETRRAKLGLLDVKFIYPMLASLAALLICAAALVAARSGSLIFAACCGLGMFIAVFLVRRLSLGRWGAGAIGITASVIVIALVSGAAGTNPDPRLAFVKKDPVTIELTQRILADAPFLGVGAGAFSSILPIYQIGNSQEREAVTAATKLSIEMGRTALWAAVIAAAVAVAVLLRASAKRGRDSFYAAAAASCLVSLIVLAFVNVRLFGLAVPFLAVIILGLGVAQSQGRIATPRRDTPRFAQG